jgi:membrane-associated phospholipid phosphatase
MVPDHDDALKHSDRYLLVKLSLAVIPAILISIRYADREIAVGVMGLLKSSPNLHSITASIPDALLGFVCISTLVMWLAYLHLSRRNGSSQLLRFLQLAATAVPAAYLLKTALQIAFGRTNTRLWLTGSEPLRFDWFHGAGTGGFPSGHMTVFTALGVAVCLVYPRCRRLTAIGLALLGAALIATDYHFLSDVIAGAYTGLLLTCTVGYLLKRCGSRHWTWS